ncbi:Uncharacterised protein [Klebsiella quasipneumoniae]|uniref:hypothetical protein n=1 Tax=Klebsiella quasipneumoniae TaxID=1463165 RepID=UPI0012519C4E|nr:hypothetical protein [Klebsiella quasipneumoniae]UMD11369.1 hypothetical protein JJ669_16190 [Klebsiella quasipneumoniae]VAP44266.1 Uncharacterised protein [Klebsiella quasipneumoniae]HBR2137810.1 hypothetical protein [Klebsiella quasipneumoniae subsp. quasipneumoniae]
MSEEEIEVVLYEHDRYIKISRFFEVAEFITKENLWDKVKLLMLSNELIGPRMIIDKHYANAIKLVMDRHTRNTELRKEPIVKATLLCAHKPIRPDHGEDY